MGSFPSIRIEGGLLGSELLDQVIAGDVPGQKPADFGLEPKRNLTDEIAAVFADSRALWGVFKNRLARLPEDDLATTMTRDQWVLPFFALLGYTARYNPRAFEVDGQTFAVSHRASEADDAPPIHVVGARQELGRVPPSGRPRLAPHSLLQEYLNRTEHVWGIVTNGLTLRMLRDSSLVRRQAYVEFDLQAIFEEQLFPDFAAVYRLLHRTRLPRGLTDSGGSILEKYYAQSIEQGGRVRERLRDGVKSALEGLGNAFLAHPANVDLCRAVAEGRIRPQAFYQQLLRLIYRLLFLMVSEERNLLVSRSSEHSDSAQIYLRYYSLSRLRRVVELSAAYTDHDDIWHGVRALFRCLQDDQFGPLLALPALNGDLFAPLTLDDFSLRNSQFLTSLWHLSNYRDERTHATRHVNFSALNVEELGSVYESLLEFHPNIDLRARPPVFELIEEGGERRSTGSHYTPPELVAPLIKHALEPVLADRLSRTATRKQNERAILSMKVCDLACGSGHFLLAAARRLGKELARIRTDEEEPPPERVREAIRDVITHCIYGVDKNPLAVELCRVALWLEGHAEAKPLTFLDHRIRCGDSLVGVFDVKVLEGGIPDEAFKQGGGGDGRAARTAKTRNLLERRQSLFHYSFSQTLETFAHELQRIDILPEDTIDQVRAKAEACHRLEHLPAFEKLEFACNVWVAAFFQDFSSPAGEPITTEVLRTALSTGTLPDKKLAGWITRTAVERRFFHWPLVFPEVFVAGGFDVCLGNPPFLGGLKISTEFGDTYRRFLNSVFDPISGKADLCVAFFRRAFDLLKDAGLFGLISTNTISQGESRGSGLQVIREKGGVIVLANRFVKWPGQATVEVNLVAVGKGLAKSTPILDGKPTGEISSRLDSEPEGEPRVIPINANRCFQGSIVLGLGFVLDPTEAEAICRRNPKNAECIFPYLTGEDLNSRPDQKATRSVIQFDERTEADARQYPELWDIVEQRVLPERRGKDARKYPRMVHQWWKHWNNRQELFLRIRPLKSALVRSRVSELHSLAFVPTRQVFADVVVVFAFDDFFHFALLQSNIHEAWVRRNASTMRTDIRYTPTDCFETFAFPQSPAKAARTEAERLGAAYHEHRREIMSARQLGLTKTYTLFHNPQCGDEDITRLRELHTGMDLAILACYGWVDLDVDHAFHQNDRQQTRYTIQPLVARDILRRLLSLNLEITCR